VENGPNPSDEKSKLRECTCDEFRDWKITFDEHSKA